jgi:hypothetical protein
MTRLFGKKVNYNGCANIFSTGLCNMVYNRRHFKWNQQINIEDVCLIKMFSKM